MSSKLNCPNCQQSHQLKDYILATDANMMLNIGLSVPVPIGNLVLKYVLLFAPKSSAMSTDRQAKVIKEMHLEGCDVDRVAYGILKVLDNNANGKLTLPLKSHGYLTAIMNSYVPPDEAEEKKYSFSDKQAKYFAIRLCQNSDFAMKYANIGEETGEMMVRIEQLLKYPEEVKKWYGYIEKIQREAEKNC